jgi:hypothetical protein
MLAQFPCNDVAGIIVEHGGEVHPAPTDDLEIGKIGLPHLVYAGCFGVEGVGRLDHHIGRAGDEIMGLQKPVNRCLGYEIALLIGEAHGQFARGKLGLLQRHPDDLVLNILANTVPHPARRAGLVFQRLRPALEEAIIPAIEGPPGDAQLIQGLPGRQMRLLDKPDDLELFGRGIPHSSSPPSAIMLF